MHDDDSLHVRQNRKVTEVTFLIEQVKKFFISQRDNYKTHKKRKRFTLFLFTIFPQQRQAFIFFLTSSNFSVIDFDGAFVTRLTMMMHAIDTKNPGTSS